MGYRPLGAHPMMSKLGSRSPQAQPLRLCDEMQTPLQDAGADSRTTGSDIIVGETVSFRIII